MAWRGICGSSRGCRPVASLAAVQPKALIVPPSVEAGALGMEGCRHGSSPAAPVGWVSDWVSAPIRFQSLGGRR